MKTHNQCPRSYEILCHTDTDTDCSLSHAGKSLLQLNIFTLVDIAEEIKTIKEQNAKYEIDIANLEVEAQKCSNKPGNDPQSLSAIFGTVDQHWPI